MPHTNAQDSNSTASSQENPETSSNHTKNDVPNTKRTVYKDEDSLSCGGVFRYLVTVKVPKTTTESLPNISFTIRNKMDLLLAPVFYLGPYSIYADCRPFNFDEFKDFDTDEEIQFHPDIKPSQKWKGKLLINANSENLAGRTQDEKYTFYSWHVDVISQLSIHNNAKIPFLFEISADKDIESYDDSGEIKVDSSEIKVESSEIKAASGEVKVDSSEIKVESSEIKVDSSENKVASGEIKAEIGEIKAEIGEIKVDSPENRVASCGLHVAKTSSYDIWHEPPTISVEDPIHLVILTHGIFSNVGGDMLFIRDKLHEHCKEKGENVIIRGYEDNIGKSYNGIQYLGERLGAYIVDLITVQNEKLYLSKRLPGITEVSFISHSLGGCVQSYALANINKKYPHFFDENNIKLTNFVTMASPLLGSAVEMPSYANFALSIGGLGKTGRDLSLKHKNFFNFSTNDENNKPVLEIVARSSIFGKFSNRTVYANTIHDGIVPLRTSALLYLDWHALDQVYKLFKENQLEFHEYKNKNESDAPIPKVHSSKSHQSNFDYNIEDKPINSIFYQKNDFRKHPFKLPKKNSKYQRLQTIKNNSSSAESLSLDGNEEVAEEIHFQVPPKPSAIIAAANLVFAKLPTQDYIHSLKERSKDVVLHDKMYQPEEIPKAHYINRPKWKKLLYPNDKKYRKEERIARYWHDGKDWRKVLVVLKGDAHNDIVVRRRFVNLFGAVAVKHLIENHFG